MKSEVFRIGVLNVGGLMADGYGAKMEELRIYLTKLRLDSIGLTECNVHWKMVPVHKCLPERTRGWWEALQITTAYFESYPVLARNQVGGVSLWSINKGAHRVMECGKDRRGLGRWVWTRYWGRGGVNVRVVTAYRPVLNKQGAQSVWNQQKWYFEGIQDDRCPRDAFVDDLCKEVAEWLELGDQLVIGIDANEDVRSGVLTTKLERLGLVENVTAKHGCQGPPTYDRGSVPIDGMFVSRTLRGCRCGYDEFIWDHRLVWIEIPLTIAFGHNLPPIVKAKARRLKCEDPRVVQRYLDLYKADILKFDMMGMATRLQELAKVIPLHHAKNQYDVLDHMRFAAMMEAEKRCRKLKMGAKQWTPDFQRIREEIKLWNLVLRKMRGTSVNGRFLERQIKKCGLLDALTWSVDEVLVKRKNAYRAEKIMAMQSEANRQSWLESLCEAKAEAGEGDKETVYRNLIRVEAQRRNARIIGRVNGKLQSGSVTSVVAPNENGEWVEVVGKVEIEKALLQENERRFNQARDTPFLQHPLVDLVGKLGVGKAATEILNGLFEVPEGVDEWAARLIPFLQKVPEDGSRRVFEPETYVSDRSHVEGWRKAKERTSSGPSGITFAHFKAGLRDQVVSEFEARMTSIPYETGISPDRWQQGINVMLEKQKGNYRVDKLRAILLYEADFNQNNKKLGREMMFKAEDLRAIAKEQFGSRSRLTAIDQSLNKRLTYDIIRQKRRPGALCSNDAKSCYDRIVHSVASLAMQRVGAPVEPIICMFTTIQNLQHRIRTVCGDSEIGFSGAMYVVPIQGVGQGNGAGPQIWAVVSTPVFNMLRSMGFGAHLKATISGDRLEFVGFAFVDDADLIETARSTLETVQEVAVRMQSSLTAWEGGLRATGGAIVPEKSHWYMIDFVWKDGSWRYASLEETNFELQVKDCEGHLKTIELLAASDARRTLGVRLAPDGNNDEEVWFLRERAKDWADRVRTGHLPRRLVWESMNTTILKSLQYPLPATTLSAEQCRSIMAPLLAQGLSSSGVVRSMPRVVVHGPIKFQGLGIPNLFTFQQTQHILRILKYCTVEDNITGQLIRHSLEATKLEIGCEGSVLLKSYDELGLLATSTWLTHTWQFLSANHMGIEDTVPELELQREGDQYLVRAFQAAGYQGASLRRLNVCRMFLQVVTVSDIATGCGRFISTSGWEGKLDDTRAVRYDWPAQGEPGAGDWDLWRGALHAALCSRQRVLQRRLGRWFATAPTRWYYDERSERLYEAKHDRILMYPRVSGRASRSASKRFRNPTQVQEIPATADKAIVERDRLTIILTGNVGTVMDHVQSHLSLRDFIASSVPKHARWAIERCVSTDDGKSVADALRRGDCIGVSDGSFKDQFGTACWRLQVKGDEASEGITCPCVVPGGAESHSAYRSELAGLYGMATMVWTLCNFYKIDEGEVELACDGLQALRHVARFDGWTEPKMPQFDLLEATRAMLRKCPIKLKFRHVKGHQDDVCDAVLDEWAELNIAMDDGAKEHWHRCKDRQVGPPYIFGEPWPLWVAGRKVTKELVTTVVDHIDGQKVCDYWASKDRFQKVPCTAVHWEAVGKAMQEASRTRRQWVVKHSSGFCATGKMMERWKQQQESKCPRCDEAVEDARHVWLCKGVGTEEVWQASIRKLHLWMLNARTQPNMAAV